MLMAEVDAPDCETVAGLAGLHGNTVRLLYRGYEIRPRRDTMMRLARVLLGRWDPEAVRELYDACDESARRRAARIGVQEAERARIEAGRIERQRRAARDVPDDE